MSQSILLEKVNSCLFAKLDCAIKTKRKRRKQEQQVTGLIHLQVNSVKNKSVWTPKISLLSRLYTEMTYQPNIRWAFNASAWKPTRAQIVSTSSYIQPEEKARISRYVFQNDAMSSLIGRLMLRKYVHLSTNMSYEEIRFGRDEKGKPYLLGAGDMSLGFNISHQGDYVVLAGNMQMNIGIDVMKIEQPVNKNIPEFFRLMNRQFSKHEWCMIYSFPTEMEQVACFYRFWCLKESYVKNIGIGINIPLHEISFCLKTRKLTVGEVNTDTILYVKDVLKDDWTFEETLLDDKHAVAVSFQNDKKCKLDSVTYSFLTFEDLVKDAKPLFQSDPYFGDEFLKKQLKPF